MNRIAHSVLKEIGFTLLAEGKTVKVRAEGYSMYPSIKPGSIIFIEPLTKTGHLQSGEIIAWKKESGFVVHRLIRILNEEEEIRLITRGDSCIAEDEPITADQLAGRVIRIENPEGKEISFSSYLKKKPNYYLNRLRLRARLLISRILG